METKATFKTTFATVAMIVVTLGVLVLNFLSEKATSQNLFKNVVSAVVSLVCISLFVAITIMRNTPHFEKNEVLEIK